MNSKARKQMRDDLVSEIDQEVVLALQDVLHDEKGTEMEEEEIVKNNLKVSTMRGKASSAQRNSAVEPTFHPQLLAL